MIKLIERKVILKFLSEIGPSFLICLLNVLYCGLVLPNYVDNTLETSSKCHIVFPASSLENQTQPRSFSRSQMTIHSEVNCWVWLVRLLCFDVLEESCPSGEQLET